MKQYLIGFVLACTAAATCVIPAPTDHVLPVIAAEYMNPSILYWQQEVERRYSDAVMLVVHGDTDPETGEWYAYPDFEAPLPMEKFVARVRLTHPDRRIVLIACNPDGLRDLDHIPDLTYALGDVWMFPDLNASVNFDALTGEDGVGSIDEFVETF